MEIEINYLKVVYDSQTGTSDEPAKIKIYDKGKLVVQLNAEVVHKPGADSKPYPCVKFTRA